MGEPTVPVDSECRRTAEALLGERGVFLPDGLDATPEPDGPVRAMYTRLAADHEAEPTVPDHGGGVPGDRLEAATPEPDGLDVERLARAAEEALYNCGYDIPYDRGKKLAPVIAREYARLTTENPA